MQRLNRLSQLTTQMQTGKELLKAIDAHKRLRTIDRPEVKDSFIEPRTSLEKWLAEEWLKILSIDRIGIFDNFFELGADSVQAAIYLNRVQHRLGEVVYIVALFNAPTVAELAKYLEKNYAGAIARVVDGEPEQSNGQAEGVEGLIDGAKVRKLRDLIRAGRSREPEAEESYEKNGPAIFILAPPRSGTTLLRVMLGGHERIFAPPELQLLYFKTLKERRAAFRGQKEFWLEGSVRAVMEMRGCDGVEAKRILEEFEGRGMSTREFYRQMQEWLGDR